MRPRELIGIVFPSGLFCYALAAWYGLVPFFEIVDARNLFLLGAIALSSVGTVLKKRRPRIGLALLIAAGALFVLFLFVGLRASPLAR